MKDPKTPAQGWTLFPASGELVNNLKILAIVARTSRMKTVRLLECCSSKRNYSK